MSSVDIQLYLTYQFADAIYTGDSIQTLESSFTHIIQSLNMVYQSTYFRIIEYYEAYSRSLSKHSQAGKSKWAWVKY